MIKTLWAGDVPLVKAFWVYGVLIPVVFIYLPPPFYFGAGLHEFSIFRALFTAHFYVSLIYVLFVLVAIWRSAMNYSGFRLWAFIAMIFSAIVALGLIMKLRVFF
jgi:hypothetical protein